jgi:hypothetical protein
MNKALKESLQSNEELDEELEPQQQQQTSSLGEPAGADTERICSNHAYGEHINLICTYCLARFFTKNIHSIGARDIFATRVADTFKPCLDSNIDHNYVHNKCN